MPPRKEKLLQDRGVAEIGGPVICPAHCHRLAGSLECKQKVVSYSTVFKV